MPEGKIIKSLSGFYYVKSEQGIVQCRGRGVFRKREITPLVGDMVEFIAENDREGYIIGIKERVNELVRPPISNVDQAILVFSTKNPDFSHHLLDRFLVMIESKRIDTIIVSTKKDLLSEDELEEMIKYIEDYRSIGYPTLFVSAKNKDGISELYPLIKEKVSVIAGQSGVGKSTLLNALRPDLNLETKEISKHLGRGRHTTRHVELLEIEGGYVADTPGFSSLDFIDIEMEDLSFCFPEMRERLNDCKFRGCLHDKEPQCAIKAAVNEGEIANYRYENYLSFLNEIRNRKPRY